MGHRVKARRPDKRRKTARPYGGQLPAQLDAQMGEANMMFAMGDLDGVRAKPRGH